MQVSAIRPDESARRQFEERGFVVVRQLAPPATVAAMRERAEADLAARVEPVELEADVAYPGAPASREAPGGRTVRRLLRALERGDSFRSWMMSTEVTGWVRALLGSTGIRLVQAHHNCVMTKHPRFSSETWWHQDIRYWSFCRNALVNVWTALGEESRENGCMRVIPGSHRLQPDPDRFDEERFFRRDLPENRRLIDSAVSCELFPGDVLFFHSGLIHAAGRNLTDERKFSAVFTWRSEDNPPRPGTRSASLLELNPDAEPEP